MNLLRVVVAALLILLAGCATQRPPGSVHRRLPGEMWIDLVQGDEVTDDDVYTDLAQAGVVYLGEIHSIPRHHEVQLAVLHELFRRKTPLVLCLEQLEASDQPALDRYNRREIDFAAFVTAVDWGKKWRNYAAYQPLCEFARQHRIPIRALNAPTEVIRAVYRGGGVDKLSPEHRAQLPTDVVVHDPEYERLLQLELSVHAKMGPDQLRPMFEAQIARDEAMAANIIAARKMDGDAPRTAVVILGAGHMRFGFGTAARVRRREPAIVERLILMSESGQLQLSAAEKSASREVTIWHGDFRRIGRPAADYLRLLPKASVTLPPGHPPISSAASHK